MVPPAPALDDHVDRTWLDQVRIIVRLNEGGVIIGLEGAHPACAGPLVELLAADGAEVRVCFTAPELLAAPEDARVILLHAARDAEFLNLARPVVASRRLRVLVWLRPGDRRELRRRARDFLDWMQESVDVPEFMPAYAREALRRVLDDGASVCWEGPPLRDVIPGVKVLLAGNVDRDEAIAAMREGPVAVHRPRDAKEIASFEEMYRAAGRGLGILWDEPAVVPAGVPRIIAEPLDWEVASAWLTEARVAEPRIEAAKLNLDPVAISYRARRELPPLAPQPLPRPWTMRQAEPLGSGRAPMAPYRNWWEELYPLLDPTRLPEDPALILPRPAAWPGLGSVVSRLSSRVEPEIHVVTGGLGSGVSSELLSLGLQLRHQRCVVMLDVFEFGAGLGDGAAIGRLTSWELVALLGVAAIRVGRDRWLVRWGKEAHLLQEAIRALVGTRVDIDALACGMSGARAPDARMSSDGRWTLPIGIARDPSADDERRQALARAVRLVVEELRLSTGREVVLVVDGLERTLHPSLVDEVIDSLRSEGLGADLVLTAPLRLWQRARPLRNEQSFSHIDDLPVLDVHEPTKQGPGIPFLRSLLERRFACTTSARPMIPGDVLDRLCWASGGRPRECLHVVRELSLLAFGRPLRSLHDAADEVLRHQREQLVPMTFGDHGVLRSLLRDFVTELPADETARELHTLGLLRLYPAPEGGYRALPHPLLVEGLLRDQAAPR